MDRLQVHHGIGRATGGEQQADGVVEGCRGHDLSCRQPLPHELDDLPAARLGDREALGCHRRNHRRAGQAHAEHFGERAHGVGGAVHRAGAGAWFGDVLNAAELGRVDLAALFPTDRLDDDVAVPVLAFVVGRVHGAAVDEDRRHVEAGGGHQLRRHDLVAGAEQHHAVEAVGANHDFDRGGDHIARRQRITHAEVAFGDAVAGRDGAEAHGVAAGGVDAALHGVGDCVEVEMAGRCVRPGVNDGDLWPPQLLVAMPHRFVERAFERTVVALQDGVEMRTLAGCVAVFVAGFRHGNAPSVRELSGSRMLFAILLPASAGGSDRSCYRNIVPDHLGDSGSKLERLDLAAFL